MDVRGAHHHGGDRVGGPVAGVERGAAGVGGRAGVHAVLRARDLRLRRAALRLLPVRQRREGAPEQVLHGRRPRLPRYSTLDRT